MLAVEDGQAVGESHTSDDSGAERLVVGGVVECGEGNSGATTTSAVFWLKTFEASVGRFWPDPKRRKTSWK